MSTLHMQTETVHSTARQMMQISAQAHAELQSLLRAEKSLEAAWQSKSGDEFLVDTTEVLRRLQMQYELLNMLAERVDREATEWEQVDHSWAASFRTTSSNMFYSMPVSIFAGGPGTPQAGISTIVPLFASVSIGQMLTGLPGWLNSFLDRFFPPAEISSPITDAATSASPPSTSFGDLLKETPQTGQPVTDVPSTASSSAQPAASPGDGYDIFYEISAQSQGTLYGSAACLPTSLSMITEYYHAKDPANVSISPEGLKNMLDVADGTAGSGVKLDKLNDDLNELGYTNVKNFQSDMEGLKKELTDGPVVANVGVKLVSSPSRVLDGPGATMHAVVVRGISTDGVLINDPWSGSELKLTNEQFLSLWNKGDRWLQTVRP